MMINIWTIFFGFLLIIKFSDGSQDFSYDGNHGTSHWGIDYHSCVGKHQSPINIEEHNVKNVSLTPLRFEKLNIPRTSFITNNGHTVMIKTNELEPAIVSGGPLGDNNYIFEQLHFHWGENDTEGSEDHINNHSFAMELHAVFYKQDYKSMTEAMKHPDGLTVFAYFYEVADKENPTYKPIVEALPTVEAVNSKHELKEPLLLEHLLITNISTMQNYFTYNGSLTTPPCLEVVTWIDFKDPQLLSHNQLAAFRNLCTSDGNKLTHNFRPVQPLSDRLVYHNIFNANNDVPINNKNGKNKPNGGHYIRSDITMLILFVVSTLFATI
ncbi:carbonic anhydrase 7-like isoform X1 [Vespa crabro]|uniref:carbonic anhydrase 7-like isoform X1 n=1 Tax=Vespa crabro TaxID=7445 RepID=UPI001F02BA8B|nr:carbonic anhydrase 7-like isoform X1 [Vespa crabro]